MWIDMKISAHIPEEYIPTSAGRMEMYKKISLILTPEDADDVTDEFIDRFGDPPRQTQRLIEVALIKALATDAGIERIECNGGNLIFVTKKPSLPLWSEVFAKYPGMRFAPTGDRIVYRLTDGDVCAAASAIMKEYRRASEL